MKPPMSMINEIHNIENIDNYWKTRKEGRYNSKLKTTPFAKIIIMCITLYICTSPILFAPGDANFHQKSSPVTTWL